MKPRENRAYTSSAQVEEYLKEVTQDGSAGTAGSGRESEPRMPSNGASSGQKQHSATRGGFPEHGPSMETWDTLGDAGFGKDAQLMGLGINEALPPFEVMEEL